MESKCETVRNGPAFMDEKCTIVHEGREYTNSGAWICKRVDTGKYEGCVYIREKPEWTGCGNVPPIGQWPRSTAGNWDGSIQVPCGLGKIYYSNFGDRRRQVWFEWGGMLFHGTWCSIDFNELVHVKQINVRQLKDKRCKG
jgi:hypothetical protein